jgi:hypothetical protein
MMELRDMARQEVALADREQREASNSPSKKKKKKGGESRIIMADFNLGSVHDRFVCVKSL